MVARFINSEHHPETHRLAMVRGAAVLYMATTGVVYGLLLSGYQKELQTTIPWVDTVVHRIMPLVLVADWLIVSPRPRIDFRQAAWWLIYPLAYCAYLLLRGPRLDWYPYPFLDPDEAGGYAAVALYCLGIAVGIALFGAIVVLLSRRGAPPINSEPSIRSIEEPSVVEDLLTV